MDYLKNLLLITMFCLLFSNDVLSEIYCDLDDKCCESKKRLQGLQETQNDLSKEGSKDTLQDLKKKLAKAEAEVIILRGLRNLNRNYRKAENKLYKAFLENSSVANLNDQMSSTLHLSAAMIKTDNLLKDLLGGMNIKDFDTSNITTYIQKRCVEKKHHFCNLKGEKAQKTSENLATLIDLLKLENPSKTQIAQYRETLLQGVSAPGLNEVSSLLSEVNLDLSKQGLRFLENSYRQVIKCLERAHDDCLELEISNKNTNNNRDILNALKSLESKLSQKMSYQLKGQGDSFSLSHFDTLVTDHLTGFEDKAKDRYVSSIDSKKGLPNIDGNALAEEMKEDLTSLKSIENALGGEMKKASLKQDDFVKMAQEMSSAICSNSDHKCKKPFFADKCEVSPKNPVMACLDKDGKPKFSFNDEALRSFAGSRAKNLLDKLSKKQNEINELNSQIEDIQNDSFFKKLESLKYYQAHRMTADCKQEDEMKFESIQTCSNEISTPLKDIEFLVDKANKIIIELDKQRLADSPFGKIGLKERRETLARFKSDCDDIPYDQRDKNLDKVCDQARELSRKSKEKTDVEKIFDTRKKFHVDSEGNPIAKKFSTSQNIWKGIGAGISSSPDLGGVIASAAFCNDLDCHRQMFAGPYYMGASMKYQKEYQSFLHDQFLDSCSDPLSLYCPLNPNSYSNSYGYGVFGNGYLGVQSPIFSTGPREGIVSDFFNPTF